MKCPIDETLMIDYLEGCCEAGLAGRVRRHLEQCPVCSREYQSLSRLRKVLADSAEQMTDEPPESFWSENVRAVAEATYLQPEKLSRKWSAWFPRKAVSVAIAAAAVLVLAITWLFELGPPRPGPETGPARSGLEVEISTEEALVDSLWLLWKEMQEYEMASNAMESIYALGMETDNGDAGGKFMTAEGYSVYDGLQELNEEQLQQVEYLVAGL